MCLKGESSESISCDLMVDGCTAGLFTCAVSHKVFAEGAAELDVAMYAFLCVLFIV